MHKTSIIFIIVLIQFAIPLNGQSFLERYTKQLFKIEDYILLEEYCEAANYYHKLSLEKFIYNRDLHNAILSSLLCKDLNLIEYFSLEALKRGAPNEYFEENFNEFDFFSSEIWDQLKNIELPFTFHTEIRGKIREMIKVDQADRIDPSARAMNDFKNLKVLNEIIERYGFPSQKDLGFDYLGDSNRQEYNRWFRIILIHQTKERPWDFGSILPELYLQGIISPQLFVHLYPYMSFCDQKQITCLPSPSINFLMLDDVVLSCNGDLKIEIDEARSSFFLDPIDKQLEKSIFARNSDYPWLIGEKFGLFHFNMEAKSLIERIETFKEHGLVPISQ